MVAASTSLDAKVPRWGLLAVCEALLENCMKLSCGDPQRYMEECGLLEHVERIIAEGREVTWRELLDASAGSAEGPFPSHT